MAYSAADVRAREKIIGALLLAPAKSGKTVAAVCSLPQPVFVFNTDGPGALDYCAREGAEFEAEDVTGMASYLRARAYYQAHKAKFKSVVFDNVTFYVEALYKEVRAAVGRDDPRAIYPEITRQVVDTIREVRDFKKHYVIIGQADPGDTSIAAAFGHILAVSGKAKILLPALVQDLLWLEVTVDAAGVAKREFLLAPAGNWTKGSRSVQGIPRMTADFTEFLRLATTGALPKKIAKTPLTKIVQHPGVPAKPTNGASVKTAWKPGTVPQARARQ
jgi:hypothetical protein